MSQYYVCDFYFASEDVCKGAIAQLGERLVCIQEVCGSIPHGSTISLYRYTTDSSIRELALVLLPIQAQGIKASLLV